MLECKFSEVKDLVCAGFPGARTRRTVKIEARTSYRVSDYWDGGSRNEARFVRLADLAALTSEAIPHEARQKIANPFNLPIATITLDPSFCVVEHVWFCGKDLGYRVYVHPDCLPRLLSKHNEVSQ